MRKVILSMNITEDGFIAGPKGELDWHFPFWTAEMCRSLCGVLGEADTILLGRKTYNAFAGYLTGSGNDTAIAAEDYALFDMMNRYTKVVVSKTLTTLPWMNSILMQGNILSRTKQLKENPGKDIIILGSGRLASYLIKHNLIDGFNLWVHPVKIGKGKLLPDLAHLKTGEKPVHVEAFSSGVFRLCYLKKCQTTSF